VVTATYDAANRQLAFGNLTLSYDANGNLVSDDANTYSWNARNQLTAITGATPGSFLYDGLGRRVRKTIGGTQTDFVYDGFDVVQEMGGSTPVSYLRSLDIDEALGRGSEFYLADALGSTLALADPSGALTTQYTYQAFGATTLTGGATMNPIGWTGRELDGTGLQFLRARYYSPTLQRFLSEDPVGLLGGDVNLYAYVGNNPIRFIDPLGLDRQDPFMVDEPGLEEPWLLDPTALIGGLGGIGSKALGKIGARVAPKLWPAPGAGRVVHNGIEYTTHALERMAPVGMIQKGTEMVSRGMPPSVVEHAIQYGTKTVGNQPGTIVHTFQNVTVVTNNAANRVITVIKTGR